MKRIKTTLKTRSTDGEGYLKLDDNIFKLGLVLNSRDTETKRLPTDYQGEKVIEEHLHALVNECLGSLGGIGALIRSANPENLTRDDFELVGLAVGHFAALGNDAQNELETMRMFSSKAS